MKYAISFDLTFPQTSDGETAFAALMTALGTLPKTDGKYIPSVIRWDEEEIGILNSPLKIKGEFKFIYKNDFEFLLEILSKKLNDADEIINSEIRYHECLHDIGRSCDKQSVISKGKREEEL